MNSASPAPSSPLPPPSSPVFSSTSSSSSSPPPPPSSSLPYSFSSSSSSAAISIEQFPTLDLLNELKRRYGCLSKPERRFIFIGAPGSGKGTQSSQLEREYCLCHISTGDMLRDAVKEKTHYGNLAKARMDRGELVKDEIVIPLLEERLTSAECKRGFILDGFPRNMDQAKSLQSILARHGQSLDGVIYFDVPEDELKRRVCGRRVHSSSGRVYHTEFKPPKVHGRDDITGDLLVHRKDDNEETLGHRLASFRSETMPLVDHYSKLGMLYKVDAKGSSADVRSRLLGVVEKQ